MFNINHSINKYFLRNSIAIPFFYKKIIIIKRSFYNIIQLITLGRLASGIIHDIANPLTSLLLSIDLGANSESDLQKSSKELSEFIRIIKSQLTQTNSKEFFFISNLIQDSCLLLKHKAISNNVRIVSVLENDLKIFGSKSILTRAVLNILNNAIESYEKCSIEKRDVVIKIFKHKKFLNISITDFGCGMNQKEKSKIFHYLYTNKVSGTGIGLYLTNRNIRKHFHGKIKVESIIDKGSKFTVQIPLKTTV